MLDYLNQLLFGVYPYVALSVFLVGSVVILAVLKVFLVDMRGLAGIYQALSFIGLGIVLLGIGWLYQRLLFPRAVIATPT